MKTALISMLMLVSITCFAGMQEAMCKKAGKGHELNTYLCCKQGCHSFWVKYHYFLFHCSWKHFQEGASTCKASADSEVGRFIHGHANFSARLNSRNQCGDRHIDFYQRVQK